MVCNNLKFFFIYCITLFNNWLKISWICKITEFNYHAGDEKYLGRFNKHYQAIMKYISQGPMLLDVHMHRPNTNSKNFMDALLAFWPGVQVRIFLLHTYTR